MKLTQAIQGFEVTRLADGYSPNTMDVYRWALDRLAEFLHDPDLQVIKSSDLRQFMYHLRIEYKPVRTNGDTSPLSGSSLENAWKAIRSFFTWANKELGTSRPDNDLPRPRYTSPEIQPLSEDDIKALLKACEYTTSANTAQRKSFSMRRPTADRDKALLLVLLDTGLRVSESARLRVRDVNLETGEIFVMPWGSGQKTKSRVVYLGKVARKAVWKYLANREDKIEREPLFLTEQDRQMDRNSIRLILDSIGKRAGVKNVHPHRFRHTFAVQYLRNGGDVFTLQRLLGHSTLEMVRKYLALADADSAEAHRKASPADRWKL